jgi:hypothetical protein
VENLEANKKANSPFSVENIAYSASQFKQGHRN